MKIAALQRCSWHSAKFQAEAALAEVGCIADIAGYSVLPEDFAGRDPERDRWIIGHAENAVESRE